MSRTWLAGFTLVLPLLASASAAAQTTAAGAVPSAPAPAAASAATSAPAGGPAPASAPASAPAPTAAPALAPAAAPAPASTAPDAVARSLPPVLPASPQHVVPSPGEALVHIGVSYQDAWLEMRSYVDGGEFLRICRAPCDRTLLVEGREARVTAPLMTTSNVFRFTPGDGAAGVRVDGGSAGARRAGIITLAIGIPVALAGMALFAQGRVRDNAGLTAAGIAGLSAGGLSVVVSLPLLLLGSTHVRDAKGSLIAVSEPRGSAF